MSEFLIRYLQSIGNQTGTILMEATAGNRQPIPLAQYAKTDTNRMAALATGHPMSNPNWTKSHASTALRQVVSPNGT